MLPLPPCVSLDGVHQLLNSFSCGRVRLHDGSYPSPGCTTQTLHRHNVRLDLLCASTISLVHGKHIGNFHYSGLHALHVVPHPGDQHQHGHINQPSHINLILPYTHRLDQYHIAARRSHHIAYIAHRARHTTQRTTCRHAADIHALVLHSDPIAEQSPTCRRTRRIHRHHTHLPPLTHKQLRHLI